MMALRAWVCVGGASLALLAMACGDDVTFGGGGAGGSGAGTGASTGQAGGGAVGGGSAGGGGSAACDCDAAYLPVCGDDGMTYDAACGEECVPTAIACDGECPCDPCAVLETAYATALAEAKTCDPAIDIEQCTERIGDALACPCPTSFNPDNAAAETLKSLKDAWDDQQCGALISCPAVECPEITAATCLPGQSGAEGVCSEIYAQP
jgi:Kazal-type serine protease inhibitor domain